MLTIYDQPNSNLLVALDFSDKPNLKVSDTPWSFQWVCFFYSKVLIFFVKPVEPHNRKLLKKDKSLLWAGPSAPTYALESVNCKMNKNFRQHERNIRHLALGRGKHTDTMLLRLLGFQLIHKKSWNYQLLVVHFWNMKLTFTFSCL